MTTEQWIPLEGTEKEVADLALEEFRTDLRNPKMNLPPWMYDAIKIEFKKAAGCPEGKPSYRMEATAPRNTHSHTSLNRIWLQFNELNMGATLYPASETKVIHDFEGDLKEGVEKACTAVKCGVLMAIIYP